MTEDFPVIKFHSWADGKIRSQTLFSTVFILKLHQSYSVILQKHKTGKRGIAYVFFSPSKMNFYVEALKTEALRLPSDNRR